MEKLGNHIGRKREKKGGRETETKLRREKDRVMRVIYNIHGKRGR